MAPEHTTKSPAVTEAEAALHSIGAPRATFDQRPVGRGHWFADWAGGLSGSEVYIGITGRAGGSRKVRLLLDDWIFDDVAARHLGEVLSQIFTAQATIRRKRSFMVIPVQVLKVSVGRARYTAARKLPPDEELSPWERALLPADGG